MEEDSNKSKIIIGIILGIIAVVVIILFCLKGCNKEFRVSFDSNGGTTVSSVLVKENEIVERPSNPTKEGYTFVGWYYYDELFDFNTKIKKDITLIAKWEENGKLVIENTELVLEESNESFIKILSFPKGLTIKDLIFTSSDSSVVKIDTEGKLSALKSGTVTITVKSKDGKHEEKVTVTVNKKQEENSSSNNQTNTKPSGNSSNSSKPKPTEVSVTGISITGNNNVKVGGTIKLGANITPSNATNKSVTWSIVSGSDKATIDQNGNLRGIAPGKVTVKVTTKNGKTATKEITIFSIYSVVLEPEYADKINCSINRYRFYVYQDGKLTNNYASFKYNDNIAFPGSGTIPSIEVSKNKLSQVTLKLQDGRSVTASVTYKKVEC